MAAQVAPVASHGSGDEWVDAEWVDAPAAKSVPSKDDAMNEKFVAWLKAHGADEDTIARGLQIAADVNDGNPNAETQLSMAGGMLGGNVGSGVGGAVGTLADGGSIDDALSSGAKNFAVSKATGAVINKLRPVASDWLQRMGLRTMKSSIKLDRGYAEKMAGSKKGGIAAMENEIAQTALDEGVNPVRRSGLDRLQQKVDATAKARTNRIGRAPNTPIGGSAANAEAAGQNALRKMSRGDASRDDIAAVESFLEDMRTSPQTTVPKVQGVTFAEEASPIVGPNGEAIKRLRAVPGKVESGLADLTPTEQADVISANNDRLRGLFNGQSKNAEVQARLAVQRARTADLDKAAGTKPLSNRMRKLIDLRNAGNIATARAERNNPVSLTDVISLSAARPAVFAASAGMKAPIQADIAGLLNRSGKALGKPASATAEALRRALLALLTTSVSPSASHE